MKIINQGMTRFRRFRSLPVLLGGMLALLLGACSSPKNISYFKDVPDTVKQKMMVEMATYNTPVIQADDILQVTIQTLDPASTALLNQQNSPTWPVAGTSGAAGAASANSPGYLVDKQGSVTLPLVGKISVKGKTTGDVQEQIRVKAAEFYKDPVVNVRFINFKITVLGEVTKPATYVMPNEKVTLLDALGMAGDLTIYGKRENVLLIREIEGKKEFVRFNLNSSNLFTSPYYYLQQGDVVYVEPSKSKVVSTDAARLRNITIISSVLTLLVVIFSRVNF
ncbi:polysaccharide biosynthesis/export family protein [Chitinophaga sp. 22321]|uniref:Polysaccharide biosynthesis/export family protein n=1 Tax=Chitinophaga hostae TaxID=2831022 RepID=A0ABS5J0T9_9BACT|nr:polysaccharide biosynthesis/export family protein [Chitinophaga hostae]MBS0028846.1 polysaccharide biosynthesis/export family protein [Chitinophaga hostae]